MRKAFDLRPLEFNDVLGRSFSLYMANFVGYLRWFLITWLLPMLVVSVLFYFALEPYHWVGRGGEDPGVFSMNHYAAYYWLLKVASLLLAFTLGANGVFYMTARVYVGANPTLNEVMRAVYERFTHVAGVGVLHTLAVGGLTLFCWMTPIVLFEADKGVGVLVGFVLWTAWLPLILWYLGTYGLNSATVMLDDAHATEAYQRSAFLTKSQRMRLVGVVIVTVLMVGAPGIPGLLSIPGLVASQLLVAEEQPLVAVLVDLVWEAILLPLFFIPMVVYYFDQRCRKEGYDLAVMARNFGIAEGEMQRYRFNPGLGYTPKGYKPPPGGRRRREVRLPAQRAPAQRHAASGMPVGQAPWGPQPGMTGGFPGGQAQLWQQNPPPQMPNVPNPNAPPLPGVRPPVNFPNRGPRR